MKKNKLIFLGSALAIGTVGILGITTIPVFAETQDTYSSVVTNLASKFNLKPEEVEQVFKDTRDQRHEERLTTLLTEGKITEEQKQYMDNHHEEMQKKRAELIAQGQTRDEIHDALEADRETFKKWLDEQNIELPMGGANGEKGMMRRDGFGRGQGRGMGF